MKPIARRILLFVVSIGLLVFVHCGSKSPAPETEPQVVVTVSSTVLRDVRPGLILGANFGCWVSHTKLVPQTQTLVKDLRPAVARFPGGNLSNNYCWVTQRVSGNDHLQWDDWSWGIDVPQYIAFLKTIGCVPMFSLNPFDHTIDGQAHSAAAEAADLARLFVANGFSGAYYEVGNENDGSWNPMLSINDYTDRFILLALAVKSVDPAAQALGPVVSGYNMSWINGFLDRLQTLGALALLDGLSYHHYGGWIANDNSNLIDLNDPQVYGGQVESIRSALAAHGVPGVKVAVTEMNAAIWGDGCTRDQFTIHQGLWLADVLGMSFLEADLANVWIHLHPGSDPHSLIDDGPDPPAPTRNYWPVALAAQTLSTASPADPVSVLTVTLTPSSTTMTAYAVRKSDGRVGVLVLNKDTRDLEVAVDLPQAPQSATGRRLGAAEYDAAAGAAPLTVRTDARRLRMTLPASSIAGLDIR